MIFNSIEKKFVFSLRKFNLILNLFIYTILIFSLCNLVNNEIDNAFGGSEKGLPMVYDQNLQITQPTTEPLNFPTGIDFLGENDILIIERIPDRLNEYLMVKS